MSEQDKQNNSTVNNQSNNNKSTNQNRQASKTHQTNKVKRWSSISIKWFIIWCVWFFFLFLLITIWALYWVITNPDTLSAVWLEVETVRNLLMIFAVLFFWLLFFFSFFLLVSNLYKFFTVKLSKFKYIIWSLLWWIFLLVSLVFWTISIININDLTWEVEIATDNLVNWYLLKKWWEIELIWERPLIAPSYFRFQVNEWVFIDSLPSEVWNVQNISSLEIDCDNWQTLEKSWNIFWDSWFFDWECLYTSQWDYDIELVVNYMSEWQDTSLSENVMSLSFDSEINISVNWWSYDMNQSRTEMLIGQTPSNVRFDAWSLFTDLWLPEVNVDWDLTWDWEVDQSNTSNLVHTFRDARLNNVHFRLPDISDDYYLIALRTQESSVPSCNISYDPRSWNNYSIDVSAPASASPQTYDIEIVNLSEDLVEQEETSRDWSFNVPLSEWENYIIYWSYETSDWEVWTCESEEFYSLVDSYEIDYSIYLKRWSELDYTQVDLNEDFELEIDVIPTDIRVVVDDIDPDPDASYDLSVLFDWETFLSEWDDSFEYEFRWEEWSYDIEIEVEDNRWNVVSENIDVIVEELPVIPILELSPDSWEEPLRVNLDASASRVTNPDDSIVYYSWDFWDWETISNSNQWQISHTYSFDSDRGDWEYDACVTVRTREWESEEICQKVFVQREQRSADINIPSHPTQSARVWDRVEFEVSTDWSIDSIQWDFWNWRTASWEWRSYATATTTYDEAWDYRIRVVVEYEDYPRVVGTVNLRIRD